MSTEDRIAMSYLERALDAEARVAELERERDRLLGFARLVAVNLPALERLGLDPEKVGEAA